MFLTRLSGDAALYLMFNMEILQPVLDTPSNTAR